MKTKIRLWLLVLVCCCGSVSATEQQPQDVPQTDMSQAIYDELQTIRKIQGEAFSLQNRIQEIREQEMDSIRRTQQGRGKSEIGIMAQIEDNTNERFMTGGLTLIAVISLVFGFYTFWYQQQTERHTKNVSITSQLGVLKDLPRHFYRNLVCTATMLWKYRQHGNRNVEWFAAYPSEANMLKLQTLPEEFILNIDAANDSIYAEMHRQKLLFKNYNLEVAVASGHFARKHLTEKSLVNDFDNLLYKPIALVEGVCKLQGMLEVYRQHQWWEENLPCVKKFFVRHGIFKVRPSDKGRFLCDTLYTFVKEHFDKLDLKRINEQGQTDCLNECWQGDPLTACLTYDNGKNGFERSLERLLKLVDWDSVRSYGFITKINKDYVIDRNNFKTYFCKSYREELEKTGTAPDKVEKIINEHKFMVLLEANDTSVLKDKYELGDVVANAIKPYLAFWKQDKWTVKELIYTMLKMDISIELPIIGMIEHEW